MWLALRQGQQRWCCRRFLGGKIFPCSQGLSESLGIKLLQNGVFQQLKFILPVLEASSLKSRCPRAALSERWGRTLPDLSCLLMVPMLGLGGLWMHPSCPCLCLHKACMTLCPLIFLKGLWALEVFRA